jgi:peroxiredoxin
VIEVSSSQGFETVGEAVKTAMEMEGPLNERLAMIADTVQRLSPRAAAAVGRLVERLTKGEVGGSAPRAGEALPNFLLPDELGRLVSLRGLLREGPVVVSFQRGHWCPYCRVSTVSLAEVQDEIAAHGARIVAILPERRRFTAMMKTQTGACFPFLTDMDNGYALSLGLVMWVGLEMEQVMAEGGVDLPKYQDNGAWFLPVPATFVIGADGIIAARYVDPDYRRRMATEDILAALRKLR